ncbi:MAG: hypothetical protein IPO60_02165 [Flavobacteriales bacterium]|nr:hypothetical protein [Flavobacteriales bacterium]MBK6893823.1 hypothetical protein [Flavobacteriales bacterium]MBK7247774.1 hypothetical protein [Flavobacteriales bacterium]MBK7287928.1 hypothetical protein [Flavobacteriales bacterium]MBK9597145.1 hypothetical protein [Flavobacteriales bacterium]
MSATVMYGISYVWHGLALTDISELKIDLSTYLVLSGLAYLVIGLGLVTLMHIGIGREWISLKSGFPLKCMIAGACAGVVIYLVIFMSGLSFASHGLQHVVVDALWQVFEQAIGGLMVSLGLIYDMHRSFMEAERVH